MRRFAMILWLTVLWLVLWRDVSPGSIITGIGVALLVTTAVRLSPATESRHRLRPVAIVIFYGFFLWKLVEANVLLAGEILTRRDTTLKGIIAVPLEPASDLVTTIVANAVSLTPGTLTVETRSDPPQIYVHVLHLQDPERVRRNIQRIDALARRSLGYGGPASGPAPPPEKDR